MEECIALWNSSTNYNVFVFYEVFVFIRCLRVRCLSFTHIFRCVTNISRLYLIIAAKEAGVCCDWLEKEAADSCVFVTYGWESQLWSADLQHKQERLCKSDLPRINPLWIFPITGRITGKTHPHIPAPLSSDEPYKVWLCDHHLQNQHQASSIIITQLVMF